MATTTTTTTQLAAERAEAEERERRGSERAKERSFEVKPGYLARLLPAEAPASPEPFEHLVAAAQELGHLALRLGVQLCAFLVFLVVELGCHFIIYP